MKNELSRKTNKCVNCDSALTWHSSLAVFICQNQNCNFKPKAEARAKTKFKKIKYKITSPSGPRISHTLENTESNNQTSETFKWLMFGFITLCLVIFFIITSEPKQTNPPSKFHSWNLPERPPTASEMRDIYGD